VIAADDGSDDSDGHRTLDLGSHIGSVSSFFPIIREEGQVVLKAGLANGRALLFSWPRDLATVVSVVFAFSLCAHSFAKCQSDHWLAGRSSVLRLKNGKETPFFLSAKKEVRLIVTRRIRNAMSCHVLILFLRYQRLHCGCN